MRIMLAIFCCITTTGCAEDNVLENEGYGEALNCYAIVSWTDGFSQYLADNDQRSDFSRSSVSALPILRDELMNRGGLAGKERSAVAQDVTDRIEEISQEIRTLPDREKLARGRDLYNQSASCLEDLGPALTASPMR